MTHLKSTALLGLFLLLSAAVTPAEIVQFSFGLDPTQEVQNPTVQSPGFGSANVTYNTTTNLIEWTISYQDLLAPVSAAHFHGPASPGVNAGIILGLSGPTGTTFGVLSGSTGFPQSQEQALLDGLVYANIHTSTYTGGEIRGQVVPEPATLAILLLGAAGIVGARRIRRRRPMR